MKKALLILLVAVTPFLAFAEGDEAGHMHGPDGRHIVAPQAGSDGGSFILSHHDMRVEGADGKAIEGVKVYSEITKKGDPDNPVHTEDNVYEPENEVYGSHMTYTEPGEYLITQEVKMPDGNQVTVEFPVFVPALATASDNHQESTGGNPTPLIVGGVLAAVVIGFVSFKMGRSSAKSTATGIFALLFLMGVFATRTAFAEGDEEGHIHGPDGRHIVAPDAAKNSGPQLRAYPTADLGESASQKVEGITFVLSIENEEMTPDPGLVSVASSDAEMIGLETASVEVSSTAGGLQTTGKVAANPNGMVQVNARAGGRIVQLGAIPGTEVSRGKMLAVIESAELAEAQAAYKRAAVEVSQGQAGIKIAESSLASAKTELDIAEKTLTRQKKLAATGAFANPELEAAKSAVSDAKEKVESAESEYTTLTDLLNRQEAGLRSGVVARFEVEKSRSQVAQAKSVLLDKKTQLNLAEGRLRREESIAQQDLRNSREIESAQADVDLARAGVTSAQNRVTQARADLARIQSSVRVARDQITLLGGSPGGGNRITITAPISAEVEKRFVSKGQTVGIGESLYELLNADIVWIIADIYESDIKRIKIGQSIEVIADAHPDNVYEGEVAFIHNEVNPDTRTTPVRIVINNPGERLKQNMFVRVLLGTSDESQMIVPSAAVQNDGGLDVVFVEETKGTYRKVVVQVVRAVGERTIVKGLKSGQTVVTNGSYQLLSMGGGK